MAATFDMESPSTELIFLGTGTSSSLPQIGCITAPPDSELPPCRTCLSTLKPEGRKNIRRNTSAALRVKGKDGQPVTIVIDAGKNFQAAAIEWFPKYGLRKIDALVITHAHADAMNGLDDLRGWTLRGIIQNHIDVYVSLDTFNEVKRSFPYLVAKEFASGGGDVPEFKFHIIHDRVPFEIGDTGVKITPISVHHGRLFSTVDRCCENAKPAEVPLNPQPAQESITSTPAEAEDIERIYPYIAFGFKIEEQLVYISDVSHIPDEAWPHLEGENKVPVVVLDCLRLREHTSHVGLEDSIKLARRMGATRTYFTGFGHEVSHDEWVRLGEIMGGASYAENELTEQEQAGLKLMGDERGLWFRPSYDGMRICISPSGQVQDDTYQ